MSENNPIQKSGDLLDDILANPFGDQLELAKDPVPQTQTGEAKLVKLIDVIPEENRAKAYQLAEQIDPTNHQAMILYGTQAPESCYPSHMRCSSTFRKRMLAKSEILSVI